MLVSDISPVINQERQSLSENNRIQVPTLGWIVRIIIIIGITSVVLFNLFYGIQLRDPFVIYSVIIPIQSVLTLIIGWFFYRNPAGKTVDNALVSVIIPVYNQQAMIKMVIRSIFESDYKNLEVIAVNDGSKDSSGKILDKLSKEYKKLKVIHKPNCGKRKAIASGFKISGGKYIVLIDSDSIIDSEGITEFVKTFCSNPKVGAVVGNVKAWNHNKNLLTKCQDVWYDVLFNISKSCESTFGTVLCCSGCFSAYRREAITDFIERWSEAHVSYSDDRQLTTLTISKPWSKNDLLTAFSRNRLDSASNFDDAEDRILTGQSLLEWKVKYVSSAFASTEVPEKLKTFLRQQNRWKKGYLRTNLFVSGFFWNKHPIAAFLFYLDFMASFSLPFVILTVLIYEPIVLKEYFLPVIFLLGQILLGLGEGIDSKFRNKKTSNWKYKPLMNLISSFLLAFLIFPAIFTIKENKWSTR